MRTEQSSSHCANLIVTLPQETFPLGESSKSPLHFAAHRDESVIVGYYTSGEVHLRPRHLPLNPERRDALWQETMALTAGSSVITAADITDTRADEAVCGVMRDGVKGIPTAQLQAQALAIMTQLSTELHTKLDALDAAIAAVESGSFYTKSEADQKFGTPYTLPPATADQLGGVKVGDYLDIAADGTLSGKTLYDTIAASVAVKSEPRLVWSGKTTIGRRKTETINVQDGVDYVNLRVNEADFNLTPGMTYEAHISGAGSLTVTVLFSADKKRLECTLTNTLNTVSVVFTGYHYPTLAELLTETQAAQADYDALDAEDSAIDAPDDVTQEE